MRTHEDAPQVTALCRVNLRSTYYTHQRYTGAVATRQWRDRYAPAFARSSVALSASEDTRDRISPSAGALVRSTGVLGGNTHGLGAFYRRAALGLMLLAGCAKVEAAAPPQEYQLLITSRRPNVRGVICFVAEYGTRGLATYRMSISCVQEPAKPAPRVPPSQVEKP